MRSERPETGEKVSVKERQTTEAKQRQGLEMPGRGRANFPSVIARCMHVLPKTLPPS